MSKTSKSKRLEFRTTERTRSLIERAASSQELSISEFAERILQREAQRILADEREFVLSQEAAAEWEALNERPAKELAGLRELNKRPSPFSS